VNESRNGSLRFKKTKEKLQQLPMINSERREKEEGKGRRSMQEEGVDDQKYQEKKSPGTLYIKIKVEELEIASRPKRSTKLDS